MAYADPEKGRAKDRARKRAYRETHRAEIAVRDRTYRETHREEERAKDRAYGQANRAKKKAYREAQRAKRGAKPRSWTGLNPETASYIKAHLKENVPVILLAKAFEVTPDSIQRIARGMYYADVKPAKNPPPLRLPRPKADERPIKIRLRGQRLKRKLREASCASVE